MVSRHVAGVSIRIVGLLELCRWDVVNSGVETSVVPPLDPASSCQLELVDCSPRSLLPDDLGLVETDDGLGEGVVIGISA